MADDKIIQHSHYKEDPLPRLEFSNLGYSAWLTKMHQIYQGEDPPEVPASISTSVDAFVNAGRWLWECIACNNATVCEVGQPSICVECATQGWVNVVFPSNREDVETELLKQPGHRAHAPIRQWRPGWDMSVLEDRTAKAQESLDAGEPFPTSLSIGATRVWSVGEILTAANKNTYERNVLEDLAGRNGPVEYEGAIVIDSLTTTERNAITLTGTGGLGASGNGLVIYNSILNAFQRYENGAWVSYNDLAAMTIASAAEGDILYIDSNGRVARLAAGQVSDILLSGGANAAPSWTSSISTHYEEFTATGTATWTPLAGTRFAVVECIGGGGGGKGGRINTGTNNKGGSGARGGNRAQSSLVINTVSIGSVSYTVGSGGAGGTTAGGNGSSGGTTTFGATGASYYVSASPGAGASAYQAATGNGAAGANGSATVAPSGGEGGTYRSSLSGYSGGAGGNAVNPAVTGGAGGTAGTITGSPIVGTPGTAAAAGTAGTGENGGTGSAGGGGYGSMFYQAISIVGGNGGNGMAPGGGGGGGGGGIGSTAWGNGGNGASGIVRIWSW